ncbi:hypothetical protein ACWDMY_01275 [Streptomyces globisporus]
MKVRTTLRPDVQVEVNEGELLDLRRHGLLVEDPEDKTTKAAPKAKAPEKKEG